MRKFNSFLAVALSLALVASCGKSTKISGVVADAPGSEVIVKLLDVNKYKVLDTVKTDASGSFRYQLAIEKGQPEFIYLFHGDTRIASLLLQNGDKVKVNADTLGNYSVTGSAETEKLMDVERAESSFANKFAATTAKLDDLDPYSEEANEVRKDLAKQYITYYRDRVVYVMSNPYSLTIIPVLYQTVGENLGLFSQDTDALHFRNAADSLSTVYPESKYVKALSEEADRRISLLNLQSRIASTEPSDYPDISLPDENGNTVKLSDMKGKVVLIYFWTASANDQKMFNLDSMKPLYDQYHDKGLDIYAVSLDTDKSVWASAVRNQKLEWTNVCDGKGTGCPALNVYPVASVPYVFVLNNGQIDGNANITDEASLRRYVEKSL